MNLKTWFKGLGVFVASSFITSLAAANLSPSTFNFTKQGLAKLAPLVVIIGVKAVALYMKQSPLPGGVPNSWTKISGAVVFALMIPTVGVITGCTNSWEQTTYATLATGKALVDCAVAGYNHADSDIRRACTADSGGVSAGSASDPSFDPKRFYIVQSREAQQLIEKTRHAQIACVEAFEAYAVAKLGKDKSVSLADKQAAVVSYLAQLPALFDAVRVLIGAAPLRAGTTPAFSARLRFGSRRSPWLQEVLSRLRATSKSARYTSPGEYSDEISDHGNRVEVRHGE